MKNLFIRIKHDSEQFVLSFQRCNERQAHTHTHARDKCVSGE